MAMAVATAVERAQRGGRGGGLFIGDRRVTLAGHVVAILESEQAEA